MLLRDPAYAIRGVGVLVFLYLVSPILVMLLLCGMLVDLWVTLRMDVRCAPLFNEEKDRHLVIYGLELKAHEPKTDTSHQNPDERWERRTTKAHLVKACDAGVAALQRAEFCRIKWQYLRAAISRSFQVAIMVLVAYWVYKGDLSLAQFLIFTSVATRACEPLTVFLSFQSVIMSNRELLRRLGLITNVDFGIKPLK